LFNKSASAEGADRGRPSRAGRVAAAGARLGEGLEPVRFDEVDHFPAERRGPLRAAP
jgi:hypothetical protein